MYSERDRRVASQNKSVLDRRQFLKLLALGVGGALLESDHGGRTPAKFDGNTYRSTNEHLFKPIETKPDYMRTAEKIVLSLPDKWLLDDKTTFVIKKGKEYVTGTKQDKEKANQETRTEVRQMYHDLLYSLPQYSEITMLYGSPD